MTTTRSYSELKAMPTFEERYRYLKLFGEIGEKTFGYDRYLNQSVYNSPRWRTVRRQVIIRDNGYDLGVDGYDIEGKIIIHHMNPITLEDIENESDLIFDPEYLITVSVDTHNAIHFADERKLPRLPSVRRPGDTKLW